MAAKDKQTQDKKPDILMTSKILPYIHTSLLGLAVAGSCILISGCGGVDIDAPILNAAGLNLNKKKEEPVVEQRSGIVLPPSGERLPDPDQVATRNENDPAYWPKDPDQRAKKVAALKKAEEKKKRDEIDFEKGDIDEFNKITNKEKVGPGILDVLGGDD